MPLIQNHTYCHIQNHQVIVDGEVVFDCADKKLSLGEFLNDAYTGLKINYPKFYKMDLQSKIGILSTEALLLKEKITYTELSHCNMVFANSTGSLATDLHYASHTFVPPTYFEKNPATFIYTLPNIGMAELSIKYNISGESICFVSKEFNPNQFNRQINSLKCHITSANVLLGWVDVNISAENQFNNNNNTLINIKNYKSLICFIRKNTTFTDKFILDTLNKITIPLLWKPHFPKP